MAKLVYTPNDVSYLPILNSTIMNPRLVLPPNSPSKPLFIITPSHASHVQAAVLCAKSHGMQIRTRSGGHDSEGLSYLSSGRIPFVMIDLRSLPSVQVDVETKTAWVQPGATLGELYYRIAERSATLGFPAGVCYTVGVGGHFSGGGYGLLLRKYGLASDNVLDARLVDAKGRVLDRESMGEDLFWAIRGGGAASFGVVLEWKVRLVDIPSKVSIFIVVRDMDHKTKKLVYRWQSMADKLHEDLLFFVRVQTVNFTTKEGKQKPKLQAFFISVFLGGPDELFSSIRKIFPELGLARKDVIETTWLATIMLIVNGFPIGTPPEVLLDRTRPEGRPMSLKAKADYVKKPVPEKVLERLWERIYEVDAGVASFQLFPYGARMSEISESETPFPHRAGNLYELSYYVRWDEKGDAKATERYLDWIRSAYGYMTPYVSKNPRSAYLNYRDLDLGRNNVEGDTSYEQASIWGRRYFKDNFKRLARVKTKADPTNFFRNEQSIPTL